MVSFCASQSVKIEVPDHFDLVQAYLPEPSRLVYALVDKKHVDILATDCFLLKMRPFNFMMLNIQPVVELRVLCDEGRLCLQSGNCEILGNSYVNQRFSLDLDGYLIARPSSNQATCLSGTANLWVEVDLPPTLRLTPQPLIEMTGNGLLRGILLSIKQRLSQRLLVDYAAWAHRQDMHPLELPESFPQTVTRDLMA